MIVADNVEVGVPREPLAKRKVYVETWLNFYQQRVKSQALLV